ncbi:hypothetical protein ACFC26_27345 [Kitasatospora purpeofusca]|uniref:hypothetical protein n=1 Tax=Kitasatospora purpeofusca TaxID=67352 RepID=UPI0035D98D57
MLQEFRTSAKPDHGLIEIYDSDACLTDPDATDRAREHVVAGTGPQIYLHSPQGTAPVDILLRVWDGPAPPDEAWDAQGEAHLSFEVPTGTVVIRAFVPEIAGCIELPRPGLYDARLSWRGRAAGARQEADLLAQLANAEGEAATETVFATHQQALEGYRLDLWWTAECSDEDD